MIVGDLVSEEVRSFALEVKVKSRNSLDGKSDIPDFAYDLITETGVRQSSSPRLFKFPSSKT